LTVVAHRGPRERGCRAHLEYMSTTHSPAADGPMDRSAPLWTLDELCAFLRTTPATVHTWRKSGRGPRAYRVGRHLLFAEPDVRARLEEHADEADDGAHTHDADGSGW
jgi:hypothetical protein